MSSKACVSLASQLMMQVNIAAEMTEMDICGAPVSADVNIFCFRDGKLWREVAGHCRAISVNDQW